MSDLAHDVAEALAREMIMESTANWVRKRLPELIDKALASTPPRLSAEEMREAAAGVANDMAALLTLDEWRVEGYLLACRDIAEAILAIPTERSAP